MIKKQIRENSYFIFPEGCNITEVQAIKSELHNMPIRRTPLNLQNQSVWWSEIEIPPTSNTARTIFNHECKKLIESEYRPVQHCTFWANFYSQGEYIPKHRDSDGDLQLIIPIVLADKSNGGDFIIYKERNKELVNLSVGDRFLFDATDTFHETTALKPSPSNAVPIRITCVCRIFLTPN